MSLWVAMILWDIVAAAIAFVAFLATALQDLGIGNAVASMFVGVVVFVVLVFIGAVVLPGVTR